RASIRAPGRAALRTESSAAQTCPEHRLSTMFKASQLAPRPALRSSCPARVTSRSFLYRLLMSRCDEPPRFKRLSFMSSLGDPEEVLSGLVLLDYISPR